MVEEPRQGDPEDLRQPAFCRVLARASVQPGSASPSAQNDRLINAQAIGLDQVEGPEDVILDRQGRLYGSTRDGNVIRFSGPDFEIREVFAISAAGARHAVRPRREPRRGGRRHGRLRRRAGRPRLQVTDETNRTWYKLNDDSRLRMADDLDIAPDGKTISATAPPATR